MSAKQQLLDYVRGLSEEEAIEQLSWIVAPSTEFPPAPPGVMEKYERAMADSEAGRSISDEEFTRRFRTG